MALEEFNHFFQENKKDKRINDKGELVPDKCDKCGSKIAVFLHGEPIYQCTNKKCKKYFGTVPCNINESYMTHEWLMKQKFPDPDSTSGTSDFDVTDNDDPDDCFCEAYDAITGEEIPIDHAYTMDEMKERTYTDNDFDKIQSKEELDAFYTKLKSKLGQSETIQEAKLPAKKRKELPDSDFALVYTDNRTGKKVRKYPVHDKEHVESAARMFPRGVPLKYQGTVARKILRRAHEFGIDTSGWKNLNKYKERD